MATAAQRWAYLERPVRIETTVGAQTLASVAGYARALGISTEDAIAQAILLWCADRSRRANRNERLALQDLIRQVGDRAPLHDILGKIDVNLLTSLKDVDINALVERNPLDRAMFETGITGRELADRLGVSPSEVSRWRQYRVIPTPARRIEIADALGCAPVDLWPHLKQEA